MTYNNGVLLFNVWKMKRQKKNQMKELWEKNYRITMYQVINK